MSELNNYTALRRKLEGVCTENELEFDFRCTSYPITLTIRPPKRSNAQMTIPELDESAANIEPLIQFRLRGGEVVYAIRKNFTINETLFNKIKNLFKKLCDAWLQTFFKAIIDGQILSDGVISDLQGMSGETEA